MTETAVNDNISLRSRSSSRGRRSRKPIDDNKKEVILPNYIDGRITSGHQKKKLPKPQEVANVPLPYNVFQPIYDWKTENKSFIDVHIQLKLLGIKNNAFHLILLNPLLQGVDPYSEDLTNEQVMMIVQECKLNMFYYLREVVRTRWWFGSIPYG